MDEVYVKSVKVRFLVTTTKWNLREINLYNIPSGQNKELTQFFFAITRTNYSKPGLADSTPQALAFYFTIQVLKPNDTYMIKHIKPARFSFGKKLGRKN